MIIYQMHPVHGRHKATTQNEATANIENGWETVTEEEFYAGILKKAAEQITEESAEESAEDELSEREKLNIRYEMKFGKKPHHMMKDETIIEKLDE